MSVESLEQLHRNGKRMRHAEQFKAFDRRDLAKMEDKELAGWQSEFETDEPQWRLAEHEWQRRLTADQIAATMKAARGQIYFGIAGVIIGVVLTRILEALR